MERGVGPWMDFHRVTQAFDLGWYEAGPLALKSNSRPLATFADENSCPVLAHLPQFERAFY